jgi:hypothetical protein
MEYSPTCPELAFFPVSFYLQFYHDISIGVLLKKIAQQ